MRLLYLGLPLGLEVLRRAGVVPVAVAFGHRAPGIARSRRWLDGRAPILVRPSLREPAVVDRLARARPDAILAWFWPNKIPPEILALAPRRAFGVHPSLLPRHRGPDPYFHAILAGDAETGVTLHHLADEYDTGEVVAQIRVPIDDEDDAHRLARKLDRPSLALLVECARRLAEGCDLSGTPQDDTKASWAPRPDEAALAIDWRRDADEVLRLVRAAAPEPMASALLGERQVLVRRATAWTEPLPSCLEPADALRTPRGVVVACGRAAILLEEVELEDGTRVAGADIDALVPST